MSDSKVIHEFQKNSGEFVRCSVGRFKGYPLLDIRVYYEDDNGEFRPTKRGVCLSTDLVDELLEGVSKLKEFLKP